MKLTPTPNDVLCGRGPKSFKHPGNQRLRTLIVLSLERYDRCESRKQKTLLIREIIQSILKGGGRFLKFDKTNDGWFDGGMQAARSRVGFAFRDARTPDKVKCIGKLKEYFYNASFDEIKLAQSPFKLHQQATHHQLNQSSTPNCVSLPPSPPLSPVKIHEIQSNQEEFESFYEKFDLDCYEPRPIGCSNHDGVEFDEARSFLQNLLLDEMQSRGILTIGGN